MLKKCLALTTVGLMAINANAVFMSDSIMHISPNAVGLIKVLDDQKEKTAIFLDLDSIQESTKQVLGGSKNEKFLEANIKIDIAPNSPLDIDKRIGYVLQTWHFSCGDFSYQKTLSNAYSRSGQRLDSNRLSDDFLNKRDFIEVSNHNSVRSATALTAKVACEYYDMKQKRHELDMKNKKRWRLW